MHRSVKVALRGGLGNQLFGWATGFALAQRLSAPLTLHAQLIRRSDFGFLDPRTFELAYFGIKAKVGLPPGLYKSSLKGQGSREKVLQRLFLGDVFRESGFGFDRGFLEITAPVTLDGYFQSWKYFDSFQEQIRSTLLHSRLTSNSAVRLWEELRSEPWIGVHVRRGDYLNVGIFALPGRSYYREAIAIATRNSPGRRIVVFSDDIDIARELVPDAHNYVGRGAIETPGEVINLLSYSAAFVGANSSLSWWASYLNRNLLAPRIFPRNWFSDRDIDFEDLLPPSWLTIDE